ncbi:hypothetical protein EDC04DRAFT_2973937 [Pisolithus marmoratus]|nr:hypothetical protein EDC04DRAFT_2973937 [Pisolithus marmoratus]
MGPLDYESFRVMVDPVSEALPWFYRRVGDPMDAQRIAPLGFFPLPLNHITPTSDNRTVQHASTYLSAGRCILFLARWQFQQSTPHYDMPKSAPAYWSIQFTRTPGLRCSRSTISVVIFIYRGCLAFRFLNLNKRVFYIGYRSLPEQVFWSNASLKHNTGHYTIIGPNCIPKRNNGASQHDNVLDGRVRFKLATQFHIMPLEVGNWLFAIEATSDMTHIYVTRDESPASEHASRNVPVHWNNASQYPPEEADKPETNPDRRTPFFPVMLRNRLDDAKHGGAVTLRVAYARQK